MKTYKGNIFIWSGGGKDYAREVVVKVLPSTLRYEVGTKWPDASIQAGDIIVDDQPEYFEPLKDRGCFVFNPFEDWII